MRVGIFGAGFTGWGGGVDFAKTYINIMQSQSDKDVILFLPCRKSYGIKAHIKDFLRPIKRTLLYLLKNHKLKFIGNDKDNSYEMKKNFLSEFPNLNIVFYNTALPVNFSQLALEYKIDVVFPTQNLLGLDFPIPWIIYLPDLQHKYYPEFFSVKECEDRDRSFHKIVTQSPYVIVESEDVKNDLQKYFPEGTAKIFVTPFYAIPRKEWLESNIADIKKYNLPDRYFLISNQFWQHKDHGTAFKALSLLHKNKEFMDVHIVCTGKMDDYRKPGYMQELKNLISSLNLNDYIHLLGYIPKYEQIEILKNSVSLIQPTLFEGNPGGISVCDAISLGKRTIISDIRVNKELLNYPEKDLATFFTASSPESLAEKMSELLSETAPVFTKEELENRGKKSLELVGTFVKDMLDSAVSEYTPPHTRIKYKPVCCVCKERMEYWDTASILNKYSANYFICPSCGFIQTEEPYWLDESYSSAITDLDIGLVSRNIQNGERISYILKFLFGEKDLSCIDYGGGYGMFTRLMRDNGFAFYWYDKYCENLFAKGHEADINSHYDVLTAFELMEHIYNPEEQLTTFCNIADTVIFSTSLVPIPAPKVSQWWYYVPEEGQHISFYTRKSLEILANKLDRNFITYGDLHIFTKKKFSENLIRNALSPAVRKRLDKNTHRRSLLQEDFNKLRTF